ncbi:MAG: hypothetical protein ACFFDH_25750 [Promethearchaeota archaeon]
MEEIINKLKALDFSEFTDFNNLKKPLDKGLWILWVCKEKLGLKKLSASQISLIIKEVKELSIDKRKIVNAFNRAGNKIHKYRDNETISYEIMKPGKDHLMSVPNQGVIEVLYFEAGKKYTSKRQLIKNILSKLKGVLKFVDPYIDIRTLDILRDLKNSEIKVLSKLSNLREPQKSRFLRDLNDFLNENRNFKFRDYNRRDLHDRYIISQESIILIGHSIKDLGAKESFAVVLDKPTNCDIYKVLNSNFDDRWNVSNSIP